MELWIIPCFLILLMQAGLALVNTGLCRAKNAAHTMSMNFLAYALGVTGFWACGFALMCGGAASPRTLPVDGDTSPNSPAYAICSASASARIGGD